MNKEELVKKWLSGTLSPEETAAFESLEEAAFLRDIIEDATAFKASHFSAPEDYQTLKKRLDNNGEGPLDATFIAHSERGGHRICTFLFVLAGKRHQN